MYTASAPAYPHMEVPYDDGAGGFPSAPTHAPTFGPYLSAPAAVHYGEPIPSAPSLDDELVYGQPAYPYMAASTSVSADRPLFMLPAWAGYGILIVVVLIIAYLLYTSGGLKINVDMFTGHSSAGALRKGAAPTIMYF